MKRALLVVLMFGLISPLLPIPASAQDGTPIAAQEAPPADTDGDGVADTGDNCVETANPDQADGDVDWIGDVCDDTPNGATAQEPDTDADGVPDGVDNCAETPNPDQTDSDGDGTGDTCDTTPNGSDADLDGVPDDADNCPDSPNPDQADADEDRAGDSCDETPDPEPTATAEPTEEAEPLPPSADNLAVHFVAADPLSYEHEPAGDGGHYDDVVTQIAGRDFWCGDVVVFLQAIAVGDGDSGAPSTAIELVTAFDRRTTVGDPIGYADVADVRINNRKLLPSDPGVDDPRNSRLDGDESVSFTTRESTEDHVLATVTVDGLDFGEQLVLRYEVVLDCDRPVSGAGGDLRAELLKAKVADETTVKIGEQKIALLAAGEIRNPDVEVSVDCSRVLRDARAGDAFAYRITITNTGTAELTNVAVAAGRAGTLDRHFPTSLSPGASETRTFTATITQAELDAGAAADAVTVTSDEGATADAVVDCQLPQRPAIEITGTCPDIPEGTRVGDDVTYQITVENTGNVTLSGVTVGGVGEGSLDRPFPDVFAPGQTETRTVTRTLTPEDATAGSIDSEITAGSDQGAADTLETRCAFAPVSAIAISARCLPVTASAVVGDEIAYPVTIENTGDTTLTGVAATQTRAGTYDHEFPLSLAPGERATRVYTGVLTQADFNAGSANLGATVSTAEGASDSIATTCGLTSTPAVTVDQACPTIPAGARVGDSIVYTVTIENAGNVTLSGVTVTAVRPGSFDRAFPTTLEPGERATRTFTTTLTRADAAEGTVDNSLNVSTDEGASAGDTVRCAYTPVTSLSLDVTAAVDTSTADSAGFGSLGDAIVYEYTVTNTGDVPLTNVTVSDDNGTAGDTADDVPLSACQVERLEIGASNGCTLIHTVTLDDVAAGRVTHRAIAEAEQAAPAADAASVTILPHPSIDLEATTDTKVADVGDVIVYRYEVRNAGDIPLTGIMLEDDRGDPTAFACVDDDATDVTLPAALAVGEVLACTTTYAVTQADIDAGDDLVMTVTVTSAEGASDDDTAVVGIDQNPDLAIAKTVAMDGSERGAESVAVDAATDVVTYTFHVENRGNVTLTDVTLEDPFAGLDPIVCADGTIELPATIAVGDDLTCSATYRVTQADIDLGVPLTNVVTARSGQTAPETDDATLSPVQRPHLSLAAVPSVETVDSTGDVVTYAFTLTNDGNTTLTGVVLSVGNGSPDDATLPECETASLQVGDTITCAYNYTVTPEDMTADTLTSTVTADADQIEPVATETTVTVVPTPSPSPSPSPPNSLPLPSPPPPSEEEPREGDVQTPGPSPSPPPSSIPLPPPPPASGGGASGGAGSGAETGGGGDMGGSTSSGGDEPVNCAALQVQEEAQAAYEADLTDPYGLDADLDGLACGHLPSGGMEGSGSAEMESEPVLEFDLEANADSANLNDTISYTYTLRNSGDVDLTGLTVWDDARRMVTCPETSLAVGGTMTCKAPTTSHTVTLEDVAAGRVPSEATADSDQTEPVSATAAVRINQHPRLHMVMTCPVQRETGETLEVAATLTNPGDVSLSGIRVVHDLGTSDVASDDLTLTLTGGDENENDTLDPGETWAYSGSYTVGDSPDAETAKVTATATNETAGRTSEKVAAVSATCTTQIQWGEEGCTSGYWGAYPELWDGKGTVDVTTTIWGSLPFNVTFGVTAKQSGLGDDVTLLDATRLTGDGRAALARYAAAALTNADAGIAYRYRAGEVMALYRDAIGAADGPETIGSVLAKPSAQERLSCPSDLATRHRTVATTPPASGISAPVGGADSTSAVDTTGVFDPSVANDGRSGGNLGATELMIAMGALLVVGLGGFRYRRRHTMRLRRTARWR